MDRELIDNLKNLGFRDYEVKVFLTMLSGIPMSASEIARKSKLVRNSIYDTLKTFVEKGYCNEIETNTVLQYQLIDPVTIFDKIEKDYQDGFKSNVELLKATSSKVSSLYKTHSKEEPDNDINIELLRGFNKHRLAKYTEIFKQSKFEVLGMFRLRGAVTDEIDEFALSFVRNGGKLRSIYKASLDFKVFSNGKLVQAEGSDLIKLCERFQASGEELRLTTENIPNITIFDRKIVFTNLADKKIPKHKQADIIVSNPDYAEQISELFYSHWDKAMTLNEYKLSIKS